MLENSIRSSRTVLGVKRAFGAIAAAAVAVMGVTVVSNQTSSAQDVDYQTVAEVKTFNPFVTNAPDGQDATYGILTKGDLELQNGHNESMMAVLGGFSNT